MAEPDPAPFIVSFLGPSGEPVGVGVLVGPRQVLTCAHVVNTALGLPVTRSAQPDTPVRLRFPMRQPADAVPLLARVVRWVPPPDGRRPGDDIAGLELVDADPPAGTEPAKLLVNMPRDGHELRVFGFPGRPPRPDGGWVRTAYRGRVGGDRIQLESGRDAALRVQPGFSGSPVFDDVSGRVVGIVAMAPPAATGDRDSYAIAPDRLRRTWPEVLDRRASSRRPGSGRPGRIVEPGRPGRRLGVDGPTGAGLDRLTVLHVSDPQFGKEHLFGGNGGTSADQAYDTLHARLHEDLTGLAEEHWLRPDLLVVTGDLAEWGLRSEFEQVTAFLGALAEAVELDRSRVVVVPGNHDVNRKACEAYFLSEEGEERKPVPPYFPKWKPFAAAFEDFYRDVPGVAFTPDEPWTLFEIPDLKVVVAGLNSTMIESHRPTDHYGWVSEPQLRWFAARLADYRARGWLRLGAVHHNAVRQAVNDDENLRDADDLDRILGETGLVNLLLHGHTHDGRLHRLDSGLIVLATGSAAVTPAARPTEVPNQYQLITLTRHLVTRHARQYVPSQKRWIGDTRISPTGSTWQVTTDWQPTGVTATFATPAPPDPAGYDHHDRSSGTPGRAPAAHDATDPDSFLGLVLDATRVRHPHATVESRPHGSYLRVTEPMPGGLGSVRWAVGVLDAAPTAQALDRFGTVHAGFAAADPNTSSYLIHPGGEAAEETLVAEARRRGILLQTFVAYQGMLDLGSLVARQTGRLAEDRIYPPSMYLPQRYRSLDAGRRDEPVREDLARTVRSWLGAESARLVLVLGDFGRGKTALLRHLALTLPESLPDVTPILVELRTLEKAPTLDELLGQHLIRQDVEEINPEKLRYMVRSGRIALLFDGFDELELRVGYGNAADYLKVLLASVTDRAKLVLTSRSQHFRSTAQVRTALGDRVAALTATRMVELEDFTPGQIMAYLTNLYEGDRAAAQARYDLLDEIEDLLGLARNPRMLAFIARLDEDRLREVQRRQGRISAAELYRELVDFWLVGEADRQRHRGGLRTLGEQERLAACTALAKRLWAATGLTIPESDLSAEVSATLTRLAERGYTADQATHTVGSGTLLVRTEDGGFTFVHQSIMEFLVADAAATKLDDDGDNILRARKISPLMADFLVDLAGSETVVGWAFQTLADPRAPAIAKQNALLLRKRLTETRPDPQPGPGPAGPGRQWLASMDLRSQDLTGRDLRGADLRGADLRGMRLERVDFTGADLREADLTGARLIEGSLRGANLAGSRWTRAALLGTAPPETADLPPELRSAAILLPAGTARTTWPQDPVTPVVAPGGVSLGVAFSPDGALLAIGRGNAVELIDRTRNQTVGLLTGHTDSVTAVAFSPDGTLLTTASWDNTARIWDPTTGDHHTTLTGHTSAVNAVAFSPDGTLLTTASRDGTARIWDPTTGDHHTTLTGHTDSVNAVVFSPDGALLATASWDNTARIWDPTTGDHHTTLTGHTSTVNAVAFSPDGTLLTTASYDGTARIWDPTTGDHHTTLTGHTSTVNAVAFSPDGTLLATASRDGTARIWDPTTGDHHTTLTGHTDSVNAVAFSPDGTLLTTASRDGTARIWDPTTGDHHTTLTGHTSAVNAVAFSPDGTLLATASWDNTARIWDPTTGDHHTTLTGHTDSVNAVAFSPDGALLATASWDNTARIWDPTTGDHHTTLTGHTSTVNAVAFSPDGTLLATASYDNTARIWDPTTGDHHTTLTGHTSAVNAVAFSPDGTLLATASWDNTARIWDPTTGDHHTTLTGHTSAVNAVAFSPDGTLLATASWDNTARIWDPTTGDHHTTLTGHQRPVTAVAFSPDGTLLATASWDNTARIWDPTTGDHHTTLTGHTDSVNAVAFSPDGTLLATASRDGTARIWDPTTGRWVATLVSLPGDGHAVLLAGGGYKIVGDPRDVLWWAVKLCRFEAGELDPYVPELRPVPADHPIRAEAG
ncbi:pentapeptide repeat-containing protein [Solwaraspora sp. WMMD1047]|uniref:pentapeptide repeat-containing protein n=1 Tax=Solwaraspora sp. WMMD1047 TaxID=3016102 RepID=UPI002417FAFE|nr:pentapeptide repeat-containing protein [Solwaraspora sp. WMMD1047]MDG4830309.1 pentapeptide repeat-containing protein [Solwaraspora sp. WMMD1047]